MDRKSFWVPFVFLVGFASIRNYSVGTDSIEYTYNFVNKLNPEYFTFNENVEYGYQLLSYIILNFTHNYFWLFFITSFLIVYSYLKTIKNISTAKNRITILIAHRLSTIMHADRIFVLEKGDIVEWGSHDALIEKRGLYYAMWRQQIGERRKPAAIS